MEQVGQLILIVCLTARSGLGSSGNQTSGLAFGGSAGQLVLLQQLKNGQAHQRL
jgi:hypothetical protein